jgi:hypothetical protein
MYMCVRVYTCICVCAHFWVSLFVCVREPSSPTVLNAISRPFRMYRHAPVQHHSDKVRILPTIDEDL